jgi:hypothetical protein
MADCNSLTISAPSARMFEVIPQVKTLVPPYCGPVAQLGARFHGMEEVVGSIPTRSTKISLTPSPSACLQSGPSESLKSPYF